MLWIERNAAVDTQPRDNSSKISAVIARQAQ